MCLHRCHSPCRAPSPPPPARRQPVSRNGREDAAFLSKEEHWTWLATCHRDRASHQHRATQGPYRSLGALAAHDDRRALDAKRVLAARKGADLRDLRGQSCADSRQTGGQTEQRHSGQRRRQHTVVSWMRRRSRSVNAPSGKSLILLRGCLVSMLLQSARDSARSVQRRADGRRINA